MSGRDDDLDDDANEMLSEFERLTNLLFERISEVADDEDIPDEWLPMLLLRLATTTRAMAYATSVAKPSAGGFKIDLDRFSRDADNLIREMKKDAERYIADAKKAIAENQAEDDETLEN